MIIDKPPKTNILVSWCHNPINELFNKTNVSLQKIDKKNLETEPEVILLFSCPTQLSMNIFLLKNVKMPTNVGILTFMSGKNNILGLAEYLKNN